MLCRVLPAIAACGLPAFENRPRGRPVAYMTDPDIGGGGERPDA